MHVTPRTPTTKAPSKWFAGDVYVDSLANVTEPAVLNVTSVHFTPGARSAWHAHLGGQTLYVTEGRGLIQSRGGPILEIEPGDVIHTPVGEEHWHGACPDQFMTHISMTMGGATWGEHVTESEYGAERHHSRDHH